MPNIQWCCVAQWLFLKPVGKLRPAHSPFQAVEFFLPELENFRISAAIRMVHLAHATRFENLVHRQNQL